MLTSAALEVPVTGVEATLGAPSRWPYLAIMLTMVCSLMHCAWPALDQEHSHQPMPRLKQSRAGMRACDSPKPAAQLKKPRPSLGALLCLCNAMRNFGQQQPAHRPHQRVRSTTMTEPCQKTTE